MSVKMTLDVAAMRDDFFQDTALIGIVSALPAYRFCWLINRKFGTNFVRDSDSDVVLRGSDKEEHFFPIYKYHTDSQGFNYFIYRLKSGKETLLPEIKQLDYLWMIQSITPEKDAEKIIHYLREITEIQLAQIITSDRLRNLNNLLV